MTGSVLNILIKLTALLLAVLLWFNVITEKQYEYELTLPVTEIDFTPGLGPVSELPGSLTVKILAEGKKLLRNDWKKAGLRIKATRMKRGTSNLEINPETVSLVRSEDISLLDLTGMVSIPVQLDRIDSVLKPVASRLAVIPADGYMIVSGKEEMTPLQIQVIGPGLLLKRIDSIFTEQKIIDGVDKSVHQVLNLESPSGTTIILSYDSAIIDIVIDEIKSKRFEEVPIKLARNRSNQRVIVDPDQITIDISGVGSIIDTLTNEHIRAQVDIGSQSGFVVPDVILPTNVELIKIIPDSIRILISP
jgi:hypothetical protein